MVFSGQPALHPYVSRSSSLRIRFQADSAAVERGFNVTVRGKRAHCTTLYLNLKRANCSKSFQAKTCKLKATKKGKDAYLMRFAWHSSLVSSLNKLYLQFFKQSTY